MLLSLGALGTAALSLAALDTILVRDFVYTDNGALYLVLLVLADVAVFVLFGAHKLQGLVLSPLSKVVETAEAIARGDLSRRVPAGETTEFSRLATSINRMTSRLLEEQAQRAHLEKVAGVGRLAAGVAHEIGNPLGAINGYAHILRGAVDDDPEAALALAGIDREAGRIDRIMRGMLEYARPRRRSRADVDLNHTVRDAIRLLEDQGALRGVELSLALEPDLPALTGDGHELEQVLVNLVLNAVDAMSGAGHVTIVTQRAPLAAFGATGRQRLGDPSDFAIAREQSARVRAWLNTVGQPTDVLTLVVADTGPGVAVSDSERIFDPFYTTKDPGKGTGLGLAVVARIVESLGGTIWVRQAREGGAAFIMYFPVSGGDEPLAA